MARYWPIFFLRVYGPRPISSHLDRARLVNKDLLSGFREIFFSGIQLVVLSGKIAPSILPVRLANHSARFGSSCPLMELAI